MATGKVNGKNKGNTFERKMANLLSERFQQHTGIEKSFRRNADSGSFFGGGNKSRVTQYDLDHAAFGDLICPDTFLFSVECKHYKSAPSFQSIVIREVTQWDTWIKQVEQDSTSAGKLPLLIIKYNNVPEFVFVKNKLEIDEIFKYKGYYAYTLSSILVLDNNVFFSILQT
jgi:hypothetical protein